MFESEKNESSKNPIFYPPCGPVKGERQKNIISFKGIPYAYPPVLERRFRAPEALPPWTEVKNCLEHGPNAMQMGGITIDTLASYRMDGKSEDCLYLNIWIPSSKGDEKLPVYVFIHGGAYATGSGSEIMYDGHRMAEQGIIVVTINYRLGALGFLATHALMEEAGTTGNYGLLDQIQALHWVKENIAAFGGDPNRVTVGGQSAGAYSVTALLLSPLAKGLFSQAIAQSGSILSLSSFDRLNHGSFKKTMDSGSRFCQSLGLQDSLEDLAELRKIPSDLLAACSMVKADQSTVPHAFSFWPVYDGIVLPKDPLQALKSHQMSKVKLLMGYNTDESSLFIKAHTNPGIYKMLCYQIFGRDKGKEILDYFYLDDEHSAFDRAKEVYTYSAFLIGMFMFAKQYALMGEDVYFYNFNFDLTLLKVLSLNTAHGMELPFVFGNGINQRRASRISNLSWIIQHSWVNFIKRGNPNFKEDYKGKVEWPRFKPSNPEIIIFDKKLHSQPLPNLFDLQFLEELLF